MRHNNGLYKVSRKLQILLEKEELFSDGHLQRMNRTDLQEEFLNTLKN